MTKNTNDYAQTIKRFLASARAVEDDYKAKLVYAEQFADSEFGREELSRIKSEMAGALGAVREKYSDLVAPTIAAMRDELVRKMSVMPTPEQVAVVQLLGMRETLTAAEINAAVPALAGCPMALSALQEISTKHNPFGVEMPTAPTGAEVEDGLRSLQSNADTLFARYGTEAWGGRDLADGFVLNRLERGADGDEADIFRVFGAVTEYEPFHRLIDRPDTLGG